MRISDWSSDVCSSDLWVQDLAASLPARLLGAGEGKDVLDLCAAPGGKTMQLAAAGWRVTAVDQSSKRLGRLAVNLARTELEAENHAADTRHWDPTAPQEAMLLDDTCYTTPNFTSHPDMLYSCEHGKYKQPEDSNN